VVARVGQPESGLDSGQLGVGGRTVTEERQRGIAVELNGEGGQVVQQEHHQKQCETRLEHSPRDISAHGVGPPSSKGELSGSNSTQWWRTTVDGSTPPLRLC